MQIGWKCTTEYRGGYSLPLPTEFSCTTTNLLNKFLYNLVSETFTKWRHLTTVNPNAIITLKTKQPYLLGAGGSGTTITLWDKGGLAGGPGSGISSFSTFLPPLPQKFCNKHIQTAHGIQTPYLGGGWTFWLTDLPSWICWKFLRKVSPPRAWTILLGSPATWGSSSFSEPG